MGMCSWNCNGCGHPLFCNDADAINASNRWMTSVAILTNLADPIFGEYDGYAGVFVSAKERVDIHPKKGEPEPTCWHNDCWIAAGKPLHLAPSAFSKCQAWFCDGTIYEFVCNHNMGSPIEKGLCDMEPVPEEKPITAQIMESSLGAFWRDSEEEVSAMVDAVETIGEAGG